MAASSRVNVDPTFSKRISELQTFSEEAHQAYLSGDRVKWCRPEELQDMTDWDAIVTAFRCDQAEQEGVQAISSAKSPGTTGDVVAAQVQIDYLTTLGRGFMSRHTCGPIRAMAHLAGRRFGHSLPSGPINMNAREYVIALVRAAKEAP